MEEEIKQFTWVMDICKKVGMEWFNWVMKDMGLKFTCEFGISSRNIKTGLVLRNREDVFEDNAKNRRWLQKHLKKVMGVQ